ncbi:hypothetical protein Tco_0606442 [Tanacetum coccineum]
MDDLNITIEEYIKLQAEKAQRRGRTFNWEIATCSKSYCDDLDFFTDFEVDYPAIVYNDALTSNENVPSKPPVSIYNAIKAEIDFSISFSDSDDEDYTFICDKDSFSYKLIPFNDLKLELVNDQVKINIELCSENVDIKPMDNVVCISSDITPIEYDVPISDLYGVSTSSTPYLSLDQTDKIFYVLILFKFADMALPPKIRGIGLTAEMAKGLSGRMLMEHMDAQGQSVFGEAVLDLDTSRALQFQLGAVWCRIRWREFILGIGLHTTDEIESDGFGAYWAKSARQIPDKGDLSAYWRGISFEGDFLGTTPSYTVIRDPMLRLCYRDMDVGSVNIPYRLARYLRRFYSGRKRKTMISRVQFIARLAKHFGLLIEKRLYGLIVIAETSL